MPKKAVKETEVREVAIAVEPTVDETLIYLGPNIYTRGILAYQVYMKGLPREAIAFMTEKCDKLKYLFVPLKQMQEALKSLHKKGTPLHMYYEEVVSAYAEEVKERGL